MRFLVLGAGRIGYAVAYDLIRSPKVEKVVIADRQVSKLMHVERMLSDSKVVPVELDISDSNSLIELMENSDVAMSCVPVDLNYELAKAALHAKTHFCDFGGNDETVRKIRLLDELARERGVSIVPEVGLAPGLISILVEAAAATMDELYEIRIRVGMLPADREEGACSFGTGFSIDGAIGAYVDDCLVIRDGDTYSVPALSDLETIEFPKPIGELEAFSVAGGITSFVSAFEGRVKHLDYKALHFPGTCAQLQFLRGLGLMSNEFLSLSSGAKVTPREVLYHQMNSRTSAAQAADCVVIKITITGVREKKPLQCVWDCVDYGDEARHLTAAAKLNAFPASIVAQMVARGDISEKGVLQQLSVVPTRLFLPEISSRGISLTMTERAPAHQS